MNITIDKTLNGENSAISAEAIRPYLNSPGLADNIRVYSTIDSTNREAKDQAVNNAAHGTVIIADSQTRGSGRFGRPFYSPPGGGLYMSIILFKDIMGLANPTVITAYAAVRVCEAIEKTCGVKPSIKWVNDIYLNGKKICGISAEAITDLETHNIEKIILGIGVNISTKTEDFPEELRRRVGSLYPGGNPPLSRNLLAAEIINRVLSSEKPDEAAVFEQYRRRLFMLGRDITVMQGEERYIAAAVDIDGNGGLIVKMKNGETRTLISGEVSLDT